MIAKTLYSYVSIALLFCFLTCELHAQTSLLTPSQLSKAKTYTSLEEALSMPDSVFVLDLSDQSIVDLSSKIGRLKSLQHLQLDRTNIKTLPQEIGDLSYLQKLSISHLNHANLNLLSLPKSLSKLKHLQSINLIGNPKLDWKEVVNILKDLPELNNLAIMYNDLEELPTNIVHLRSLEQIWMGKNPKLDLEDTFHKLSQLPRLQQFGLGGSNIKKLPTDSYNMDEVVNIWLAGNQLEDLGKIDKLANLKSLVFNNNQLKTLPHGLLSCAKLESLRLKNNPKLDFKQVCIDLQSLDHLKSLDIGNNQLSNIPDELRLLKNLRTLILSGNNIKEIKLKDWAVLFPYLKIIY